MSLKGAIGGDSSKSSSTKTETNTLDPWTKSTLSDNLTRAKTVADAGYTPYTGSLVAGFNPTQVAAQQGLIDLSGQHVGSAAVGQAVNTAAGLTGYTAPQVGAYGYTPSMISTPTAGLTRSTAAQTGPAATTSAASVDRGSIRDVSTAPISASDIAHYQNPFDSAVVDASLADLERQRQIEGVSNAARATANHAWGGTGAAIADSLTNDNYTRAAAATAAQLRQAGFNTSLAAAQADAQRKQLGDTGNQNVDLSVGGTNAGYQQQASQFNANAQNDSARYNTSNQQSTNTANADGANTQARYNAGLAGDIATANAGAVNTAGAFEAGQHQTADSANQSASLTGANLRLAAAGDLAGFGGQQQTQAITDAGLAAGVGDSRQANQQALLDAQLQEYLRQYNGGLTGQQLLNQTVGLIPTSYGTTTGSGTSKGSGTNWSLGFDRGDQTKNAMKLIGAG